MLVENAMLKMVLRGICKCEIHFALGGSKCICFQMFVFHNEKCSMTKVYNMIVSNCFRLQLP